MIRAVLLSSQLASEVAVTDGLRSRLAHLALLTNGRVLDREPEILHRELALEVLHEHGREFRGKCRTQTLSSWRQPLISECLLEPLHFEVHREQTDALRVAHSRRRG